MQSTSTLIQPRFGAELKRKLFNGLDSLLPMPQVVLKAQSLMLDPNSGFDELAGIIETDQEITRNILNVANSAYYSLKNKVCSVRQASLMLGLDVIAEIIMAASTSSLFSKALEAYNMSPKELWQHSLAVALGSRKIADAVSPAIANEAFLSGLFHDVGKLVLDEQIFSRDDSFKKFLADGQNAHFEIEKQILGFDHSEIAAELCKKWKFPKEVTRAIRRHHVPTPDPGDELICILGTADKLSKLNVNGNGGGGPANPIDDQVMDFLSMDENDLMHIMAEVTESVSQIAAEIFGTT